MILLLVAFAVSNHVFVTSLLQSFYVQVQRQPKTLDTIQYPHVSLPLIVSSSPSLLPSISIITMTPTVETPSCAYTNIQPDTYNFKEHHGDHQEEEHQQPDPAYMAEFPCAPSPCEPQPFNAFRISCAFLHPCTECTRRNPKLKLPPQIVMHAHKNSDSHPRIILPSLPHTHGRSMAI